MDSSFFPILILIGVVFSVAAMFMYIFPPKKINYLYGYRTPASMMTEERWHFAQKYSSLLMLKLGVGMILLSAFGLCFSFSKEIDTALAIFFLCIVVVTLFFRTESEIKRRFPV